MRLMLSRRKSAPNLKTALWAAEEEQSRQIFGGNFQTHAHDGNKAAGLKVIGWGLLA